MSAPLTTRDALADVLAEALPGLEFTDAREDAGHLADALLASGALTDAGKLEAIVTRWEREVEERGVEDRIYTAGAAAMVRAAALSAQSERAEVEE